MSLASPCLALQRQPGLWEGWVSRDWVSTKCGWASMALGVRAFCQRARVDVGGTLRGTLKLKSASGFSVA